MYSFLAFVRPTYLWVRSRFFFFLYRARCSLDHYCCTHTVHDTDLQAVYLRKSSSSHVPWYILQTRSIASHEEETRARVSERTKKVPTNRNGSADHSSDAPTFEEALSNPGKGNTGDQSEWRTGDASTTRSPPENRKPQLALPPLLDSSAVIKGLGIVLNLLATPPVIPPLLDGTPTPKLGKQQHVDFLPTTKKK